MKALRILVVDDNPDSADMLAAMLEMYGHQARAVYDAARALDLAASENPDVIFVDIGMPVVDGYELVRRLRALPGGQEAHVVATTGFSDVSDRRRAEDAGFDSFLVKPIDLEEVEKVLKKVSA